MEKRQPTSSACPECGVMPGEPHLDDCSVQRCSICGSQWISCECPDHETSNSAWTGDVPAYQAYDVIEDFFETEICECAEGDQGEYDSFGEARLAAINYLAYVISDLQGIKWR